MAISRKSIEVHAIAGKHGTLSKNYLGEESGAEYSVSTAVPVEFRCTAPAPYTCVYNIMTFFYDYCAMNEKYNEPNTKKKKKEKENDKSTLKKTRRIIPTLAKGLIALVLPLPPPSNRKFA